MTFRDSNNQRKENTLWNPRNEFSFLPCAIDMKQSFLFSKLGDCSLSPEITGSWASFFDMDARNGCAFSCKWDVALFAETSAESVLFELSKNRKFLGFFLKCSGYVSSVQVAAAPSPFQVYTLNIYWKRITKSRGQNHKANTRPFDTYCESYHFSPV